MRCEVLRKMNNLRVDLDWTVRLTTEGESKSISPVSTAGYIFVWHRYDNSSWCNGACFVRFSLKFHLFIWKFQYISYILINLIKMC